MGPMFTYTPITLKGWRLRVRGVVMGVLSKVGVLRVWFSQINQFTVSDTVWGSAGRCGVWCVCVCVCVCVGGGFA